MQQTTSMEILGEVFVDLCNFSKQALNKNIHVHLYMYIYIYSTQYTCAMLYLHMYEHCTAKIIHKIISLYTLTLLF